MPGEQEEESVSSETPDALLDRVRKLLVKAEADGVTQAEAQALTGKAAELMAKYGIDRALLAARRPETERPGDRHRQSLGPGPGPPVVRAGGHAALPVRDPAPHRPGVPDPRVRVRVGHRAHRRPVHLRADPD